MDKVGNWKAFKDIEGLEVGALFGCPLLIGIAEAGSIYRLVVEIEIDCSPPYVQPYIKVLTLNSRDGVDMISSQSFSQPIDVNFLLPVPEAEKIEVLERYKELIAAEMHKLSNAYDQMASIDKLVSERLLSCTDQSKDNG
jgi:hypothetical protein